MPFERSPAVEFGRSLSSVTLLGRPFASTRAYWNRLTYRLVCGNRMQFDSMIMVEYTRKPALSK